MHKRMILKGIAQDIATTSVIFAVFLSLLAVCAQLNGCKTKPPVTAQQVTTPHAQTKVEDFSLPGFKPEWSAKVREMLTSERLAQFNVAQADFTARFCPGYGSLSPEGQRLAWGHLVSAIVKFESSFKPETQFDEPSGPDSIGLLQLSYGDAYCPKNAAEGSLKDPIVNIECGMKLMANFLAKDGVVAAGGYTAYGAPSPKGLARYWSVVRVPDRKSNHKLSEITTLIRQAPGC